MFDRSFAAWLTKIGSHFIIGGFLKQAHLAPRIVLKVPVAQEPPVPIVTSSGRALKAESAQEEPPAPVTSSEKVPKVKPPAKGKGKVFQEKQRRKELLRQAEGFSQQTPGLNPQNAYEILLGQYTLEEWKARRQASQARKSDRRSDEEKAWCYSFLDAPDREPIWLETAKGERIVRVSQARPFLMVVQKTNGKYRGYKKTELSALCSARLSPQVLQMRQIVPEAWRNALPAENPKDRWLFPEDLVSSWIGQRVKTQLLNGSTWTGFLRWNSRYTLLLGAQPAGDPEVMLFKHACCGIQLLHQSG